MAKLPDNKHLSSFPQSIRQLIETIERSGPLGTSAVIGMYGRTLELLATESTAGSASDLAEQAIVLIEYFLNTRGRFTVAVANSFASLRTQLGELQGEKCRVEEVSRALLAFSRSLESDRQDRLSAIAATGAAQLAGAESLLLYDYSSTVLKVVAELVSRNENLKLVVPESRTCDGGLPILRQGRELACEVWFVPDVTIAFAMPNCNAVLVGVETFFRNGSFTNTVGSLTTAIVAGHFSVPFYAVTDLTKADREGNRGTQPPRLFSESLAGNFELADEVRVETTYPPLERVPGCLVTAYITEKGVMEPAGVWSAAMAFSDEGGA